MSDLARLVLTVDENLAEDTAEVGEVLVNADDWRELVTLALVELGLDKKVVAAAPSAKVPGHASWCGLEKPHAGECQMAATVRSQLDNKKASTSRARQRSGSRPRASPPRSRPGSDVPPEGAA